MFGTSALMTQTVTVLRRVAGQDDRGNDTWTETEQEVEHCDVQPLDSVEYLSAAADQVVSRWQFFGPPGLELQATDRIRVDGQVYAIDGLPGGHRAVSPGLAHTSAILKEVTG